MAAALRCLSFPYKIPPLRSLGHLADGVPEPPKCKGKQNRADRNELRPYDIQDGAAKQNRMGEHDVMGRRRGEHHVLNELRHALARGHGPGQHLQRQDGENDEKGEFS